MPGKMAGINAYDDFVKLFSETDQRLRHTRDAIAGVNLWTEQGDRRGAGEECLNRQSL